jgi:hypothetical protein
MINKSYLSFFAPFWTEHIQERGRLKADELDKLVTALMTPPPAPAPAPPPAPVPAPTPPATNPWQYLHPPPPLYPAYVPPGLPPFIGGLWCAL